MRPTIAAVQVLLASVAGCGTPPAPPPAPPGGDAGRAAVHRVVGEMHAGQTARSAAWDQSVREGKTPTPTAFFDVEVAALERAELRGCPADFATAFRELVEARRRQLRAATRYAAEVPAWDRWVLVERQGVAAGQPAHEREIAEAARAYDAAWDRLGAVCARYP